MRAPAVLLGILSFLGVVPGGCPALRWDSTSCHLAGLVPGSPLSSLSFLGKDAQGLALFQARWDARRRLQACSRQDEPELTAAYRTLCTHEATRDSFTHTPGPELQRALATLQREACAGPEDRSLAKARERRATAQAGAQAGGYPRVKRGWTVPGTLWCGVGDSAGNSSKLGKSWGPRDGPTRGLKVCVLVLSASASLSPSAGCPRWSVLPTLKPHFHIGQKRGVIMGLLAGTLPQGHHHSEGVRRLGGENC